MKNLKTGVYKDFQGNKYYYQNGMLHRENDLPAIEWSDGSKSWYYNNLKHRINGFAIDWKDGRQEYWFEGIQYTEKEFNLMILNQKQSRIMKELGLNYSDTK